MKKYMIIAAAALCVACQQSLVVSEDGEEAQTKVVRFNLAGDMGSPTFTRSIAISESEMTDLWVFDYVDGALVQTMEQSAGDANFGTVDIPLSFGEHTIYFVASRGLNPEMNEEDHIITWAGVRDTYWQSKTVNVTNGSASEIAVEMDRVVTKLRLSVLDEIPAGISSLNVTTGKWYYGLDWTTGLAESERTNAALSVNIPASYVGTTGQVVASFFSLSDPYEWNTSVEITAKDTNGSTIGHATIPEVPFKANRASEYSGWLFGSSTNAGIWLNDDWDESHIGTW